MPYANGIYSLSIIVHIFSSKSFQFFKTFSLDMRMFNIWKLLGKKEKNMPKHNATESYWTSTSVLSFSHACMQGKCIPQGKCFHASSSSSKLPRVFLYKITRRKLKRGNSLLSQSVNSPFCARWRMRWRTMAWIFPCIPYSYRNTAFSQSKLHFQNVFL